VLLRTKVSERTGRIRFAYDQQKAGELAAHFLQLAGGSIPLLKLLKLMYLADRTSLIETGFPITGDTIVAMDNGPVLSKTYDHLKPTGSLEYVRSEPGDVSLQSAPPHNGRLSDYEVGLVDRVFKEFGHQSGSQLIARLHASAPEWRPPPRKSEPASPSWQVSIEAMPPQPLRAAATGVPPPQSAGSSVVIDPADILRAAGKSEDEIDAVAEAAQYFSSRDRSLA
jgi:uncharacterized phage-associated protein